VATIAQFVHYIEKLMTLSRKSLKQTHTPQAISERLAAGPSQIYLKDMIYGAIDGAITTFAIVSGVAGAGLSVGVIIIMGLANLLADGFSMAVSNYLGTRAENQRCETMRQHEYQEMELYPEGEREEVRQIYAMKGFSGKELDDLVTLVTSNKELWVNTMLQEEHGIGLDDTNPILAGVVTFIAFLIAGSLPLISFVVNWVAPNTIGSPYIFSSVVTLLAFFVVGLLKGKYVNQRWYVSGFETVLIGAVAASLAFSVGYFLNDLVV
jgi:VIT1/CCC1 family predicted Fe2+/Mn2+ transporter